MARTTTGFTAGTWYSACAVFASATSRSAYINGGSKATDTTSRTETTLNETLIGAFVNNGPTYSQFFGGGLADAAIWNVALSDAEVALLEVMPPFAMRPDALVGYWPLFGDAASPEPDFSGRANTLTITGTTRLDHPPKISAAWHAPVRRTQRTAAGGAAPRLRTLMGVGL